MDYTTTGPAPLHGSGNRTGLPSFSARLEETYLNLGMSGQEGIYSQHGGGTMAKHPPTHPLTGEKEKSPSFSLFQDGDRLKWKCHKTGEHGDLFDFLERLQGKDGARHILGLDQQQRTGTARPPAAPIPAAPTTSDRDTQAEALAFWNEAEKADPEQVNQYHASRGITIPLPDSIRFHASKRMAVAKIIGQNAEFLGINRTWFMKRQADGKLFKKMLGRATGGSVHLAEPTDGKLGLSEGIESGLSGQQATGLPVWSCLSTSGLKGIKLPDDVREVWIFADSDPWNEKESLSMPGQKAARTLAQRLTDEGRTVRTIYPCDQTDRPEKTDFNDMLQSDPTGESIRERVKLAELFVGRAKEKPADGDDDAELEAFIMRSPEDGEEASDGRKIMKLAGGGLHWITEKSQKLLFERNPESLFERTGGILVRLVRTTEPTQKTGVSRPKNSLSIVRVSEPWLQAAMTSIIKYLKLDKRSGQWFPVDAPPLVAKVILDNEGNRPFHHLAGIVTAPTMRADGSILDRPGYDIDTGLMYAPSGAKFPTIPTDPTRDQALTALATLADAISGFPFVGDADRSVALAAILTALVRPNLRTSPLFAITAPKMASGKTLLADVVGMTATGRPPTTMSHEPDPAAEAKRVLAILMNGDQVAVIDNISAPIHSDTMCTILTQTSWTERLLGVNKTAEVSTCCLWLATGNNLVFRGDLSTRVLLCSLDPRVERPEERPFDRNLHEWIPENRGQLVAAGLTVLRAFHVAERPRNKGMKPFGRFEAWSDLVRAALIWLDQADPCQTREKIESSDPVREGLRSLLSAWHDAVGERAVTLPYLCEMAAPKHGDVTEIHDRLNDALKIVASESRGEISPRRLAAYCAKHENRIEGGLRVVKTDKKDSHNYVLWSVRTDDSLRVPSHSEFCVKAPCGTGKNQTAHDMSDKVTVSIQPGAENSE